MSDRTDRKLQQVVVGKYGYRHEAEFAAGFLDDAAIPYRLQVDDPVLGLTLSTSPATLWVLGVDERRARAVLDHDVPGMEVDASIEAPGPGEPDGVGAGEGPGHDSASARPDSSSARPSSDMTWDGTASRHDARKPGRHRQPAPSPSDPRHPGRRGASTVLGARERFLALTSGSALGLASRLVDLGGAAGAALVIAALLVVIGVAGRAPAPVKRFLAALSGESP